MPSRSEHDNCWIEVDGVRYGPLTCTLVEDAGSPAPQQKHGWDGIILFPPGVEQPHGFMVPGDKVFILILNDGRRREIGIGRTHISGDAGWLLSGGISFFGRSPLNLPKEDENS